LLKKGFAGEDDSLTTFQVRDHATVKLLASCPQRLVGPTKVVATFIECSEFLQWRQSVYVRSSW
jgi:hypothetical protein